MIHSAPVRHQTTRRGLRLLQHGIVLSEVLAQPGATHSVFDVLAAALLAAAPGPRAVLLGFAAGGLLAPLRAMGWLHPLSAVDIDDRGFSAFRQLCGSWCGKVTLEPAEAGAWLQRQSRQWDVILEDLSIPRAGDVVKPDCVWSTLPSQVSRALAPGGVALFNLLHPGAGSWPQALESVARAFPRSARAHALLLDDFENRLLLLGANGHSARQLSAQIKSQLLKIRSRQSRRFNVRSVQPLAHSL